MIDWTNPSIQVTEHFTVKDCLYLHNWGRLATEADGADFDRLTELCFALEKVRDILNCPMRVHCIFRSEEYNKSIPGAPTSDPHSRSMACDFDCQPFMSCDDVKNTLLSHIEELGLRMEDNGAGATWVHIDLCPVIHNRFFKP